MPARNPNGLYPPSTATASWGTATHIPSTQWGTVYSTTTHTHTGFYLPTPIYVNKDWAKPQKDVIEDLFELAINNKLDTWLMCDGSSYDPSRYPELASVLGDTYGKNSLPLLTNGGTTTNSGYYIRSRPHPNVAVGTIHLYGTNLTTLPKAFGDI